MTDPDPLREPLRIAFAGDWHMNTDWARTAIRYAAQQGADVIVQLGDFGYRFDATFLAGLRRELTAAGVALLFVDGNHEAFPTLLRYPIRANGLRQLGSHVWHLPRGFRWHWAGLRWLALGGASSVDRPWRVPGVSWWQHEEITEAEITEAVGGGEADVLVSHDCPAGVDIPGLDASSDMWPPVELIRAGEHRKRLRRVVDAVRPRIIWHGHYHRRYSTAAELGYGPIRVEGLDCDATRLEDNVVVVSLTELATPMVSGVAV